MRRWLIALATALVAGALWVGAAYADAGPHGRFNDATGSGTTMYRCASCHRAHTAKGPELIKTATVYDLCISCHGPTGSVDAIDGIEWNSLHNIAGAPADPTTVPPTAAVPPSEGTKAGGFVNSFMNTTLALTAPTQLLPSTSAHRVQGIPLAGGLTSTGQYKAWGIGGTAAGAGNTITIECTTCHDPHGGAGGIDTNTGLRTPTYRILRADIATLLGPTAGAGAGVVVPDVATKTYTVADVALPTTAFWTAGSHAPGAYYGQTYEPGIAAKLNDWCATCHTRIHTSGVATDPATTSSGDPIFSYRHETTGTGVDINLGTSTLRPTNAPGCVSCHTGHGSSAKNTRLRGTTVSPLTVEVPGGDPATGPYLDSSLLRLDLRGVCEVCHNK